MRIVVHDYCGHPFQVQLSAALAERGHEVLHLYSPSVTSPRGRMDDVTQGLTVGTVTLRRPFSKYRPVTRLLQECEYGQKLSKRIGLFGPDVVISGNTPLLAQALVRRYCARNKIPFVFWLQDLLGIGIKSVLARRKQTLGRFTGRFFEQLEQGTLRNSESIVAISSDFLAPLTSAGVKPERVSVIENWAPIEDVPVLDKANPWTVEHDLGNKDVVLYAGTLGLKHDPKSLLRLAEALEARPTARLVVASEGPAADWLRAEADSKGLRHILMLDFQPFERVAEMLAGATVLTVVLEPDAGIFSVPSKVLTYLCAARPIVASVPSENLSARILTNSGAGIVVPPGDDNAMVRATLSLLDDPQKCATLGANARRYAEATFDVSRIATRFESLFSQLSTDRAKRTAVTTRLNTTDKKLEGAV